MQLRSLRKDNTIKILYSIQRGNDTIAKISNDINLSQMSVSKIVKELSQKGILVFTKPKTSLLGRRTMNFSISDKFYVAYAEEFEGGFSVILIDAKEHAVDRFNIFHKEGDIGYTRTFNRFINRDDYKNCVGIFMDFANPNHPRTPKRFIKMNKEEIIISAFSDVEKITLFETKDKLIISVYGKIIYSYCAIDEAKKVLSIDEIYDICNDTYDLLFKAMAKHTIKRIITLID